VQLSNLVPFFGCEVLNCRADSLEDSCLCSKLSNSGFQPISIFSLEILKLNKFVKLLIVFMGLFKFGQGRYPPFGNVTHSVVCLHPIFLIFSSPRRIWRSCAGNCNLFSMIAPSI
jgi:hypothetical protein